MELADQQASESQGLTGAEIPAAADVPAPVSSEAPADKPLSLREQIVKNVEAVRTEEAKRARAADGKFAKLEKTEASAAEKPAAAEIPKPEQNAQPEASPAEGPPSAWKGIWESMSPEARAIAVKRESEVAKGFEEYRGKVKQYEALEQVLAPARTSFQQDGAKSDAEAISNILSWEQALRNPATRVAAFQQIAQRLQIDLSTLVPRSASEAPSAAQEAPDPYRPVIDQFGQQLNEVRTQVQNWEQQQIAEKISSFAKDKPHFEAVRANMGKLMQAGMVASHDLEGAYQMAINLDPTISAQIRATEEKAKADELARANAEKAKRAAAAAVSPSPRPPAGGASSSQPGKSAGIRASILNAVNTLREEQRA